MYYTYDKSNRLLTTESDTKPANYQFTGNNTYDYDGNLLTLSRSSNGDNFVYTYYTGTNRLRSINTNPNLYQYDYNGNMISDGTRTIFDVVYDYRNLIIEFKRKLTKQEETIVYRYQYRYDEQGNRIEKITDFQKEETWVNIDKEYYIRDVSGKEIAVHTKLENADWLLSFYNVWGLSNEGQILLDGNKYFYLKDHLGSVRAIYDQKLNLISAVDLDAWGYELTNRTYNDTNKYKFTSKERDKESTYDYFGARYYDSRIGNWNAPDPLFAKHLQWSPYNYVLRNPLALIDPNGKQIRFSYDETKRQEELSTFKNLLPKEYNNYFDIINSEKEEFLLDYNLLSTAQINEENENYVIYEALLFLAKGPEITEASLIKSDEPFYVHDIEINKTYPTDFENNAGLLVFSIPSGKTNNPQMGKYYSNREINEIYIRNDLSELEQAKTLGHEIGHTYRYLNKLIWGYEDLNPELKKYLNKIEGIIEKNYGK